MNTKVENRILKALLQSIDSQEKVLRKLKIIKIVLIVGPIIVLFIYTAAGIKKPNLDIILSVLTGFSIGLSVLFMSAYNQIPIVRKYLNKEEIEKRLEELNNPNPVPPAPKKE